MDGQNKKSRVLKKEIALHIFLITLAIAGSIYNIQQLKTRKHEAKKELVDIFMKEYIKTVRPKLVAEDIISPEHGIVFIDVKELRLLFPKRLLLEMSSSAGRKEEKEKEARKECSLALRKLYKGKFDNPFLFGFQDVSKIITDSLEKLLLDDPEKYNVQKGKNLMQSSLTRYFIGKLKDSEYLKVCDMFIYVLLLLGQMVSAQEKASSMLVMSKEEYIHGVCLLGELSTALLGEVVPTSAFYKELTGAEPIDSHSKLQHIFFSCVVGNEQAVPK